MALADGLPADRLMLGVVPHWVADDTDARAILLQAWLRKTVFPDHRLMVDGQAGWLTAPGAANAMVAALAGAPVSLLIEPIVTGRIASVSAGLTSAASTARAVRSALSDGALHGDAEDLASMTLRAAGQVLDRLSDDGWESLLGPVGRDADNERLGRSAVVERAQGPLSGAHLLKGFL